MIICYSYDQDQEKPCKVIWDITAEIVCMHKAGEPNNGICYRSITELTNPLKIGNDHHYYWHGKWIQTVVTKPIFKYSHFSTFQLKLWTMLMKRTSTITFSSDSIDTKHKAVLSSTPV